MPSNNPSIHMLYICSRVAHIAYSSSFSMCSKDLSSARVYPSSFLRVVPEKATRARLLLTSLMKKRRLQKRNKRDRKEFGGKMVKVGREMELVNLKLFWENRSIMEENKRLREKALHLRQENRALLSRLLATQSATTAAISTEKS